MGAEDGIDGGNRERRPAFYGKESLMRMVLVHARRRIVAHVERAGCRDVAGDGERCVDARIGFAAIGAADDDLAAGDIGGERLRGRIACGPRDDEIVIRDGDDEGLVARVIAAGKRHLLGGERRAGGRVRGKAEERRIDAARRLVDERGVGASREGGIPEPFRGHRKSHRREDGKRSGDNDVVECLVVRSVEGHRLRRARFAEGKIANLHGPLVVVRTETRAWRERDGLDIKRGGRPAGRSAALDADAAVERRVSEPAAEEDERTVSGNAPDGDASVQARAVRVVVHVTLHGCAHPLEGFVVVVPGVSFRTLPFRKVDDETVFANGRRLVVQIEAVAVGAGIQADGIEGAAVEVEHFRSGLVGVPKALRVFNAPRDDGAALLQVEVEGVTGRRHRADETAFDAKRAAVVDGELAAGFRADDIAGHDQGPADLDVGVHDEVSGHLPVSAAGCGGIQGARRGGDGHGERRRVAARRHREGVDVAAFGRRARPVDGAERVGVGGGNLQHRVGAGGVLRPDCGRVGVVQGDLGARRQRDGVGDFQGAERVGEA